MRLKKPLIMPVAVPIAGCVTIKAPEKEGVVCLQKDAANLITANPALFPQ